MDNGEAERNHNHVSHSPGDGSLPNHLEETSMDRENSVDHLIFSGLSNEELQKLLVELTHREKLLRLEKQERDEEFGRHRAMFKEMYMQKEGEMGQVKEERLANEAEFSRLHNENVALQMELADIKSVAMIAESSSKDEMEGMRERFAQEVASMEQAMRATIEDQVQSIGRKLLIDNKHLTEALNRLQAENESLKRKSSVAVAVVDKDRDRQGILATMARKVGVNPSASMSSLTLLKTPSSEEEAYNQDMRKAKDEADWLKSIVIPLEEEIDTLKSQLQEAMEKVEYYEQEKLKLNYSSNDSLDSLARKFGAQEFDLSTAAKSDIEMYLGVLRTQKVVLQEDSVNCRRELAKTQKLLEQERDLTQYFRKCLNTAQINPTRNRSEESLETTKSDNVSLRSADGGDESPVSHNPDPFASEFDLSSVPTGLLGSSEVLEEQQSPIRNKSPLTKSQTSHSSTGSSSCVMCINYESQLQAAQKLEQRLRDEVIGLGHLTDRLKEDLKQEQNFRGDMDRKITKTVGETQTQISELYKQLGETEKSLLESQSANETARMVFEQTARDMCSQREKIARELEYLEKENEKLINRYSKHSRQMQEESINLPTDMEDLHHLLLQYQDNVIKIRVAKEHVEDELKSEILFLRDQLVGEQQNKDGMIEVLSKETDFLRERIGILDSEKSEVERQHRTLMDQKLEESLAGLQSELHHVQSQLTSVSADKAKLEKDLHHSRSRAQALQVELDNSEAVQRDFVKLSQSLQVELEKIRQSENEVRWQFDEDVDECNSCRQPFLLAKKKVRSLKIHCRHCGKIFCHDCLSKEATSGPNRRAAKVCDVCHTILNRETAPYFSRAPPSPK